MGLLDLLKDISSDKKDNNDGLTEDEREHLKEGYDPQNFEEDEMEDDDYYYEDDE